MFVGDFISWALTRSRCLSRWIVDTYLYILQPRSNLSRVRTLRITLHINLLSDACTALLQLTPWPIVCSYSYYSLHDHHILAVTFEPRNLRRQPPLLGIFGRPLYWFLRGVGGTLRCMLRTLIYHISVIDQKNITSSTSAQTIKCLDGIYLVFLTTGKGWSSLRVDSGKKSVVVV